MPGASPSSATARRIQPETTPTGRPRAAVAYHYTYFAFRQRANPKDPFVTGPKAGVRFAGSTASSSACSNAPLASGPFTTVPRSPSAATRLNRCLTAAPWSVPPGNSSMGNPNIEVARIKLVGRGSTLLSAFVDKHQGTADAPHPGKTAWRCIYETTAVETRRGARLAPRPASPGHNRSCGPNRRERSGGASVDEHFGNGPANQSGVRPAGRCRRH